VIEPADQLILLASRQKGDEMEDWRGVAEELDLGVFAELKTVLEDDFEAGWPNRQQRTGVLRSVSREDFEQRQIDALDDKTLRVVKQLATDLLKECEDRS